MAAPLPTSPVAAAAPSCRWRRLIGFAVVAAGVSIGLRELSDAVVHGDAQAQAALASGGIAALATALGTLPVLLSQRFSQRTFDTMMGFGAGVMLAACAFSLIVPALEAAKHLGHGPMGGAGLVAAAVLLGGFLVMAADRTVPHEHFFKGLEGQRSTQLRRTWLFVFAIVLHNVPEGLSIGVAHAAADPLGARALGTGIAIQDIPEGLVVALALHSCGYGRAAAALVGAASGLVEPLAALVGVALMGLSVSLLPWGLAGAAGAMLYVISHEIIPESHRAGHESFATGGLMGGFVLMMFLDTALG